METCSSSVVATAPVPPARRVLIATDLSEGARVALERGLAVARARDAEVVLLHVVDTRPILLVPHELATDVAQLIARVRAEAAADVRALVARCGDGARIGAVEVREGRPVEEIVACARERGVDLIVVGTEGRSGLARFFLGSVAERVARMAPCDVLIARPAAAG